MNCPPALLVSVDGPDGAGKTALIRGLSQHFGGRIITLRRAGATGFLPDTLAERVTYFRTTDPFVAARAYLGAHMARLSDAALIGRRLHWRAQKVHRAAGPLLIVADRGPHSVLAYLWATLRADLRVDPDTAWEWVLQQGRLLSGISVDLEVLLNPAATEAGAARRLVARTDTAAGEREREELLVELQIEALLRPSPFAWPTAAFNPFRPAAEVLDGTLRAIAGLSSAQGGPPFRRTLLLSEVLSTVRDAEGARQFHGSMWLCRGLVEKGYSDNDMDVIADDPADHLALSRIFPDVEVHRVNSSPGDEKWLLRLISARSSS